MNTKTFKARLSRVWMLSQRWRMKIYKKHFISVYMPNICFLPKII